MKYINYCLLALFIGLGTPKNVSAGGSAEASALAITHSLEAIAYALEGGFKVASGAAATPLMFAGELGAVSGQLGHALYEEANAPPHGAFPVTDEVITVQPAPAEQLNRQ